MYTCVLVDSMGLRLQCQVAVICIFSLGSSDLFLPHKKDILSDSGWAMRQDGNMFDMMAADPTKVERCTWDVTSVAMAKNDQLYTIYAIGQSPLGKGLLDMAQCREHRYASGFSLRTSIHQILLSV
jgi:hypothetical protein